jgi:hypothetical protein
LTNNRDLLPSGLVRNLNRNQHVKKAMAVVRGTLLGLSTTYGLATFVRWVVSIR